MKNFMSFIKESPDSSLSVVVADLHALQTLAHNMHWNMKGAGFNALHKLYDALYEMAIEQTDLFAERLRALQVVPPSSAKDVMALTKFSSYDSRVYSTSESIDILTNELKKFSIRIQSFMNGESEVNKNMLAELAESVDKFVWLISSEKGE